VTPEFQKDKTGPPAFTAVDKKALEILAATPTTAETYSDRQGSVIAVAIRLLGSVPMKDPKPLHNALVKAGGDIAKGEKEAAAKGLDGIIQTLAEHAKAWKPPAKKAGK
jgi:hypothetical protein